MSNRKIRVLFVCLGNICRSPSAEGLFRAGVAEAGLQDVIEMDSAGSLEFQVGKAPDARAQKQARAHGVELKNLRARIVCREDFQRFDYIVAMDAMNLADLERDCPLAERQRLSLMMSHAKATSPTYVPDPYGGEVSFERVWQLLEDALAGLLARIRKEHSL